MSYGEPKLCTITGGYDNADKYTIVGCALNELREEGGYDAPSEAVIPLGTVYPSKGSDTVQHLFAVDLYHEGVIKVEATGDGTKGEKGSYTKWVSRLDIISSLDPLNATMLVRLEEWFKMRQLDETIKRLEEARNKIGF